MSREAWLTPEEREAHRKASKRRVKRSQYTLTANQADNNFMPYTRADDEIIRTLSRKEAALALGRTTYAINDRRHRLAELDKLGREPIYVDEQGPKVYPPRDHSMSIQDRQRFAPVINPCTQCFCTPCTPDCEARND